MESIRELLKNKKITLNNKPQHRGNSMYGVAVDLERKLDIPISLCFRLLKKFTPMELSSLTSWWKDYPFKKANNIGLLYWKLKQLYPNKFIKK